MDLAMANAYKNLAVNVIAMAIEDFAWGVDSLEEFEEFCRTNRLIDYLGFDRKWVYEQGLSKKRLAYGKKRKKKGIVWEE